jgi:hypothetical protein
MDVSDTATTSSRHIGHAGHASLSCSSSYTSVLGRLTAIRVTGTAKRVPESVTVEYVTPTVGHRQNHAKIKIMKVEA